MLAGKTFITCQNWRALVLTACRQVETWLSDVDVDGDGQLSYAEFKMSLAGNLLIDI